MEIKGDIRKVQWGKSVKTDSYGFEVGQTVGLGAAGSAVVDHIEEVEPNIFTIFIKKGDSVIPWKKGSMPYVIEYSLDF